MTTLGHQLADDDPAALDRILAAATETQGNVSHMARMLKVSLRTVQYWCAYHETVRDAVKAARDARIEPAEALAMVPRDLDLALSFAPESDDWVCRIGAIEHRASSQALAIIGAIRALQ